MRVPGWWLLSSRERDFRFAVVLVSLLILCSVMILVTGCAALNPSSVNRDITTGIADAGQAALTAQQEYQAGTIPQTTANRTAINTLGNAYDDAKTAWLTVLQAEAAYQAAVNAQLASCAPGSAPAPAGGVSATRPPAAPATACQNATAAASTANSSLTTAQTALDAKISALSKQTAAVQAISK